MNWRHGHNESCFAHTGGTVTALFLASLVGGWLFGVGKIAFGQTERTAAANPATSSEAESPSETNASPNVQINFKDGMMLRGHLAVAVLPFQTESLGATSIPLDKIRTIAAGETRMVLSITSGDRLEGKLRLADHKLRFKFCLGEVDVPVDQIARVSVFPPGKWWDLTEGLVARWQADGDARDATGRHDGELLFGAKFAEGIHGRAFLFDGARSRVSVPDHPAFKPTNSFSIEGWLALPKKPPHPDASVIFNRGDIRGGFDSYQISVQADGRLAFTIWDPDNKAVLHFSPVPKDRWVHVAAVFDFPTGTMQWYVNGVATTKLQTDLRPIIELDPNSEPAVGLGNHGGKIHNFPTQCLIDEWGYYSRALGADEVEALYRAGDPDKPRRKPPWLRAPGEIDL